MHRLIVITLTVVVLCGCGNLLKSDYQRPMLSVPPEWRLKESGTGWLQNTPHWWDNFQDPLLSRTLSAVLVSNNDLAKAGLQLQLARLEAGLTDTNATPDVSVGANANNSRNLRQNRTPEESYSSSLSLSYELDLWGRLARAREQAQWLVQASEQDRQNTALTLIGTTADFYWQIANLNQNIASQRESIVIAQQTLQLAEARYAAGAVGQTDVLQARQTLLSRQNQLSDYEQQRERARNATAILFNTSPLNRQPERTSLDPRQDIPVVQSLPVAALARRPDVKAAEWRLRAALAGSDAARLSFWPTLSLSASLNAGSAIFNQWFTNPVSSVGSAVALPFVQWNTVQLTVAKSHIEVQQAAIDFRSAVYNALADVDNAQAERLSYARQRQHQLEDLQLSLRRLDIVQSQYRSGAVSFQTLLDAQDTLLRSKVSISALQYGYLNATMKLWLALGGGARDINDDKGLHDE
ncbi:efflux transporter outer membrane subunit [Dryocola clanedunensis]